MKISGHAPRAEPLIWIFRDPDDRRQKTRTFQRIPDAAWLAYNSPAMQTTHQELRARIEAVNGRVPGKLLIEGDVLSMVAASFCIFHGRSQRLFHGKDRRIHVGGPSHAGAGTRA